MLLALIGLATSACGGQGSAQAQGTDSQGTTSSQQQGSFDQDAVGQAIGKDLDSKGSGVYEVDFPRTDIQVTSQSGQTRGLSLDPSLDLGSEIYFQQIGDGSAMVMGELVLTEDEVDPVLTQLEQGGVDMTALHKHQPEETPSIWWLHVHSHGDPVQIAKTLRSALDQTGTPSKVDTSRLQTQEEVIDSGQLDQILGYQGQVEGGVYKYDIPYGGTITDTSTNTTVSPKIEAAGSSGIFFQPTGGGKAITNGELLLTEDEVNPVAKALRDNNIEVVSLHNHFLDEEPRTFFMHFWGYDDATTLAQGLRAALDKMNVGKSSAGG